MPAMPPAHDQGVGVDREGARVRGPAGRRTRRTPAPTRVLAFSVASSSFSVTQETCSRTQTMWKAR